MVIDVDLAAIGHLDAQILEAEPVGIGFAPGCDQHDIGIERHVVAALLGGIGDLGLGFSTPRCP